MNVSAVTQVMPYVKLLVRASREERKMHPLQPIGQQL